MTFGQKVFFLKTFGQNTYERQAFDQMTFEQQTISPTDILTTDTGQHNVSRQAFIMHTCRPNVLRPAAFRPKVLAPVFFCEKRARGATHGLFMTPRGAQLFQHLFLLL